MSPMFNQTVQTLFQNPAADGSQGGICEEEEGSAPWLPSDLENASSDWVPPLHGHVEPPECPADTPTLSRPSPQFGARSPPQGLPIHYQSPTW